MSQIVELQPLEVASPGGFTFAAARLTAFAKTSARKLSEFHTLSERGDGKASPCSFGRRAKSCARSALRAGAHR